MYSLKLRTCTPVLLAVWHGTYTHVRTAALSLWKARGPLTLVRLNKPRNMASPSSVWSAFHPRWVCVPHVLKFYSEAPGRTSVHICRVQWFLSITVHVPRFWQMFLQSLWGFSPLYFSYSLFLELLLYGYGASLTSLLIFLPFLLFCTPLAIFELHFLGDFLIVTFRSFWVFHFCCHIFNLKRVSFGTGSSS